MAITKEDPNMTDRNDPVYQAGHVDGWNAHENLPLQEKRTPRKLPKRLRKLGCVMAGNQIVMGRALSD